MSLVAYVCWKTHLDDWSVPDRPLELPISKMTKLDCFTMLLSVKWLLLLKAVNSMTCLASTLHFLVQVNEKICISHCSFLLLEVLNYLENALFSVAILKASMIALLKSSWSGKPRISFQTWTFLNVLLSSPSGGHVLESWRRFYKYLVWYSISCVSSHRATQYFNSLLLTLSFSPQEIPLHKIVL